MELPERFNAAAFFLDRHLAEGRGGRTAIRYRGRHITYAELAERARRAAGALAAHGVQMEQRVLLALPDCPEFAEVFWGAVRLGAVPVPVLPAPVPRPDPPTPPPVPDPLPVPPPPAPPAPCANTGPALSASVAARAIIDRCGRFMDILLTVRVSSLRSKVVTAVTVG